MIDKETIEDAFIHLEDDFRIHISLLNFASFSPYGATSDPSLYNVLQVHTESIQSFLLYNRITLDAKGESFYKFDEWNRINREISMAIKRLSKDTSSTKIYTDEDHHFLIDVPVSKQFQVENIQKLILECRSFNRHYNSRQLTLFPEFHYEKGIVIYLREIPSKDGKRFDKFNQPYDVVNTVSGAQVNLAKDFLSPNFNFVKKFDTQEQVLQDNQFLKDKGTHLAQFIIYELEPKFNIIK